MRRWLRKPPALACVRVLVSVVACVVAAVAGCTGLNRSNRVDSETPSLYSPGPRNCPHQPLGGFGAVWANEQVYPRLWCAVAPAEPVSGTEAYLCCAHSLWLGEKGLFVAVQSHGQRWAFIPDESGVPVGAPLMVAPEPRGGPTFVASGRHGWLATSPDWVEQCGGLSCSDETPFLGAIQKFEGGWLLWNGNVCFVLFADGTWIMF